MRHRRRRRRIKSRVRALSKAAFKKVFGVFLTIFALIVVSLYNQRPIIHFRAEAPESVDPNNCTLIVLIKLCNTGATSARVSIFIIIESLLTPYSDWIIEEYHYLTVRISAVLIGGDRNYTVIPVRITLLNKTTVFNLLITIQIHISLNTIFREIYTLSPTQFRYTKQGDGKYHLSRNA